MSPGLRAALYSLLASCLFVAETVVVKAMEGVPLALIVLARALGQIAWAMPALVRDPVGVVATRRPGLNILRGAFSATSWYLYFLSFAALPLATATVLSFTTVLFVGALAGPVLGERVDARRWAAILVGFAGVVAVVQPWNAGGALPTHAFAAAIGSAMLGAAITLSTKSLSRTERTPTIMFYVGLVTLVLTLPVAAPLLAWPGWGNALLLLAVGTCGPLAMRISIAAYRLADASYLSVLSYVRLVLAAGLGVVLFAELPDAWLALGAVLIIGSAVAIVRMETRAARAYARKPEAAIAASSGDGSKPKSR